MRLIDADVLKESIKRQCDDCRLIGLEEMAELFEKALFQEIDNAPTIEERAKGRWILDQKSGRRICSECLACASRDDFGKEYLSDYCTVCGADMRGVTS